MKRLICIVFVLLIISLSNCEKMCDKIDGQKWDREKQQWVPLDQ